MILSFRNIIYHSTTKLTMTTSSTKINEWGNSPSGHSQDTDWVMINEDGHLINEDFELIDAAEARCWCGGSDAERCRRQGHSWPLCNVDQGKLWPDSVEDCYQPLEEGNETGSKDSAGEQSKTDGSRRARQKPPKQNGIDQPGFYESGPFTKLSILTEVLGKGRYSGA